MPLSLLIGVGDMVAQQDKISLRASHPFLLWDTDMVTVAG